MLALETGNKAGDNFYTNQRPARPSFGRAFSEFRRRFSAQIPFKKSFTGFVDNVRAVRLGEDGHGGGDELVGGRLGRHGGEFSVSYGDWGGQWRSRYKATDNKCTSLGQQHRSGLTEGLILRHNAQPRGGPIPGRVLRGRFRTLNFAI